MYIEDRLFSENTEETLYSILLDEDEYALYSEFQKEFGLTQLAEKLKKIKPKSVKWKNKRLKKKILLETFPSRRYFPKEAIQSSPDIEKFALKQARRDLRRGYVDDILAETKANRIVNKNQAAKSRLGSGLYVKNPDPLMETKRQEKLKLVTDLMHR